MLLLTILEAWRQVDRGAPGRAVVAMSEIAMIGTRAEASREVGVIIQANGGVLRVMVVDVRIETIPGPLVVVATEAPEGALRAALIEVALIEGKTIGGLGMIVMVVLGGTTLAIDEVSQSIKQGR
mmetsp:Transcript_78089/g.123228  ORF Transcript_78089/g.123228 Transcript_78089/m.123228 type:complete len:125 (+) Transcript_78089:330-704(+)